MNRPLENKLIDIILLTLNTRDSKYEQVAIKANRSKDGSICPLGFSPYLPKERVFSKETFTAMKLM